MGKNPVRVHLHQLTTIMHASRNNNNNNYYHYYRSLAR